LKEKLDSSKQARDDGAKCWIPVVADEDRTEDAFQLFLEVILNVEKNPPSLIAQVRTSAKVFDKPQQFGPHGIWVVSYS
jgi:hypothetical protein